jgi:hypothetical protein
MMIRSDGVLVTTSGEEAEILTTCRYEKLLVATV